MKKIISVTMALLMIVSLLALTSCGKTYTVNEAIENTNKKASFETNVDAQIKMNMGGMEIAAPMTMNIKTKNANTDKPETLSEMSMSILGQEIKATAYSDGEYVYTEQDGTKVKVSVKDVGSTLMSLENFDDAIIEKGTYTELDGGARAFEAEVTDEEFKKFGKDLMGSLLGSLSSESTEYSIKNCKVKVTFDKDGLITEEKVSMDMTMSLDMLGAPMEVSATADMTLTFKNYDKTDFEKPDLTDYVEADVLRRM